MNRIKQMALANLLALALLGAVCVTLDARSTATTQDVLCVNPGGTDGCYASIQAAVGAADDGDTIQVAEGAYYETVVLTKSLTLEGGWNADFTARDWEAHPTTIDARRLASVIRVDGAVSPTIEGFIITGGDGGAFLGWGGGILVHGDWGGPGMAVIRHNVITDNVACSGDTCQGYGGGLMVYSSQSVIEYNTVISNAACTGGNGSGHGGGIAIWGHPGDATIGHNVILSNTALLSTTGAFATGEGGGVWGEHDVVWLDNEVRGNVAAGKGPGYGGGAYAGGELYGNRILSNTASVSGTGYGGGVYADYVTDFDDNIVQGNLASADGDGSGGGVYGIYLADARRNTFVGNVAARGGGVYLSAYPHDLTLRDNLIARNRATGDDFAALDGGGGLSSAADQVEIINNRILSNTADALNGTGGGVQILGGGGYVLQDNLIAENSAAGGGGIAVYTATGAIVHNQVFSNTALLGGGMYLWGAASPALDRNVVMSNTAAGGGGVWVSVDGGTTITLTNHIIARNAVGPMGLGAGVLCGSGNCNLFYNTIADNDRGDYKEGVFLASTAGSHVLWNNIIVGHSVGVSLTTGAAALDYNDYFDNDADLSGVAGGLHDRADDPQFEDRATNDYHLGLSSPLIDQGDDSVSLDHDYEGDPRPRGGGVDIGADEAYPDEVYVSANIGSDLTGTGALTEPFATVSKGLAEVRSGGAVYVARGTYTERITVTRSVDLLGGYHEADWSRDISANVTTLDAQASGTVVVVQGAGVAAIVEGFYITGGEASTFGVGGGVLVYGGAVITLRYNTITGNHAQNGGGGAAIFGEEGVRSELDSNRIFDNVAEGEFPFSPLVADRPLALLQGPEPGGGLLAAGGSVRIVNNLIYSNTGVAGGDGMALLGGDDTFQVLHNTVADNGGVGVEIHSADIQLYNNLIVGHDTGVTATVQAAWDYNGFFDNGVAYVPGLNVGLHDVSGDPYFADRAGRDFHLGPASVMAGRGVAVGVTVDLDGAARPAPVGTNPDLGAYEVAQQNVFLPLVLRREP